MARLTPEQQAALDEYKKSIKDYTDKGPAEYTSQGELILDRQGNSEMSGITTDPKYREHQLEALRELENVSKEGLTARDRADMARTEAQTNRANRGRVGAIQNEMALRGTGGSGMDLVAQLSSAQSANEIDALKALEREAVAGERRSQATRDLGTMSAGFQDQEFRQAAAKAQAQDMINQFNTNTANGGRQATWANNQSVSNLNTGATNDFSGNALNAKLGGAQLSYNAATEAENAERLRKQQEAAAKAAKKSAMGGVIGGVGGAIVGGYVGGPTGAAAGYGVGSQVGSGVAGYAEGGRVPGDAMHPGDDPRNDTVHVRVSPGEEIRSREDVAQSDAVADLLEAVATLQRPRKAS